MKLRRSLFLSACRSTSFALLVALAGCASPAKRLLTSENAYLWANARHAALCRKAVNPAECFNLGDDLKAWYAYLGAGKTAMHNSPGAFPLQLKDVRNAQARGLADEKLVEAKVKP